MDILELFGAQALEREARAAIADVTARLDRIEAQQQEIINFLKGKSDAKE